MSIAVDTNIVVRYIVRDDAKQAEKADIIFDKCSSDNPILINQIDLVEVLRLEAGKFLYEYPARLRRVIKVTRKK